MKKNIFIACISASLVIGLGFLYFKNKQAKELPQLQDRKGAISMTSEWLNTKKAIEELQYRLRRNPEDYKTRLQLALAFMQEARITGEHPYYYPAALQLLDEVLSNTSEKSDLHFQALTSKASVQLSLHQFREALETGNKALSLNNYNASVYGVLTDAYTELGDYTEAVKMADQMVSIRPDIRSYSRVSYLREIHGDLEGAIKAMDMAVKAGFPGLEQTAWARINLAKLYEKKNALKNAEMHYKIALEERKGYPFAIGGLAGLEAKKGNHNAAITLYNQAAMIIPEFSFYEELAKLYKKQADKKAFDKTADDLIKMLDEDQEAGHRVDLELAKIYQSVFHDLDKALEHAEAEYKLRPENIDVNYCLASIYYEKKDYKKAEIFIAKATRTKKADPELQCLSGIIDCRNGKKSAGIEKIKKALKLNPYMEEELLKDARLFVSSPIASGY